MRLFVGLWPPPDVLDALAGLPRPEHPSVRWTSPEQWHVTLRFLGEVAEDAVPALLDALLAVGRAAPPRAGIGPATSRLGRSTLVVPVAGVDDLAAGVRDATGRFGSPPEARPFVGHLTLARGRGGRPIPPALGGRPVSASWPVTAVALVRSRPGAGCATYETVAEVSLGAPPAGPGSA